MVQMDQLGLERVLKSSTRTWNNHRVLEVSSGHKVHQKTHVVPDRVAGDFESASPGGCLNCEGSEVNSGPIVRHAMWGMVDGDRKVRDRTSAGL